VTLAAAPLLDLPTIILPQQAEIEAERTYHASVPSRSYGRSAPAVISKVEVIIQFALAQQGDPYVWAKAGPNAYDCSGLVLRAYSQVGINLPHYTGTMINKGSKVSRANLQRGDIIFPTSGHVGIYLGNGQMIHASSGKGKVVVAPMYSFYAARRLV
jgi:cell wall-associated NlpC family hydrolase